MNRIKELFATDSKKLIVFITAGFPNKDSTKDLVLEAIKGGADMIEIGIPFSDPQADGPVIQEANEIALKNYSDLSSGKSLPFANLDEKMVKKDKK